MAKKAQFKISDELNKSLVTGEFRASYEHLVEPWSGDEDKPARYSVQMIFDKDDPFIPKAKKIVKQIATEAFGPNAVKLLRSGKLHNPFRDGDDEFPEDETYQGKIFVNANGATVGKKPTGLYTRKLEDIRKKANPEDIMYSGCYCKAEIKFFPFDREGGKGVACFLFRVQKVRGGEPLAGGRPVEDVFEKIEGDDDDDDDMNEIEVDDDDDDF